MTDSPLFAPLTAPIVRPLRWIGLAIAIVVAAVGAGFGVAQAIPMLYVLLATAATFALTPLAVERVLRALGRRGVSTQPSRRGDATDDRSRRAPRCATSYRKTRAYSPG